MKKLINITGQKFGKLTVLKEDEKRYISPKYKKKAVKWICQCECGTIVSVIGSHLRSGTISQCKKCQYEEKQLNGYISANHFNRIKNGAKKRGIYFDKTINREYLWELYLKQNRRCALSNILIHFSQTVKKEVSHKGTTSSLDRIDSSQGYTKNNIQWVHKDVNIIKGHLNQNEFINLCKKIWNNNEKK